MSSKMIIEPSAPPLIENVRTQVCYTKNKIDKPNAAVVQREADGVVKGETEGLVDFLTALSAIEQVRLDVLYNRDERTASTVRNESAVRAADGASDSRCKKNSQQSSSS
jgi:hypothetical protein